MNTRILIIVSVLVALITTIDAGYGYNGQIPPPAAPSNLTAAAVSFSQINLSWTDNSNNEYLFRIERKIGSGGTWSTLATVGANVTSYSNTNLTVSTTYYYRVRGHNDGGPGAWSNEANATTWCAYNVTQDQWYGSIQSALNDANDNDEIKVAQGTWNETIDFNGVDCVLRSSDPNDYNIVAATIISANGGNAAATFDSGEGSGAVLQGLTLTSGTYGVLVSNSSSPTIKQCIIRNNSSYGLYSSSSTPPTIKNCIVYDNDKGMGFSGATSAGVVRNNTIVDNTNYGILKSSGTDPNISNCIIWDCNDDLYNCNSTYSCISDGDSGTGNISSAPRFVNADINDFHIDVNTPCFNTGDPNGDYSDEKDIDNGERVFEGRVDIGADESDWYILYGMEVISVTGDSNEVTIVTTGAEYVLSRTGMEMWRRIDPKINDVNERKVATLDFGSNIGPLVIGAYNKRIANVESDKARFDFYSDSMFFVKGKESFTYDHNNLIIDAPWNAPIDTSYRHLDRMWTDGYGGSLHAKVTGTPADNSVTMDKTTIEIDVGDVMAHMVFPPKLFDFESLCGQDKRPFVHFVSKHQIINSFIPNPDTMVPYEANSFGAFECMGTLYYNSATTPGNWLDNVPVLLSPGGILGYDVNDAYADDFITVAHNKGFKVLAYLTYPSNKNYRWKYPTGHPKAGQYQEISVTLGMMKGLQEQYGLDGWYLDGGDAGGFMADYNFIRQLRSDIGDANIIYHHESGDVWCIDVLDDRTYLGGLKAVFYDAYVNYTLNGETRPLSKVDSPNDGYFRYISSGYGLSQAYGEHIRKSDRKCAISEEEKKRVMGENLNGADYSSSLSGGALVLPRWEEYFKPGYKKRKAEYLNDANVPFAPDVNWPINSQTGWFRMPTDVNIINIGSTSATITWVTDSNSNSEVVYTSDGIWWSPNGPDGTVSNSNMTTSHNLPLTGLSPGTNYEFRIRSNNGDANIPGEIIWGYVGGFTTDP